MGSGFFVHHKIVSALKRVEFVSDRMSQFVVVSVLLHIFKSRTCAPP